MNDKQFHHLTKLWKEDTGLEKSLAQYVSLGRRKLLFGLFMEVAASVLLIAFYYRLVFIKGKTAPPILAVAIASMLFLVIWLTHIWRNYKESLQNSKTSVEEHLKKLKERLEAKLRWTRAMKKYIIAFLIFAMVWGPWMIWYFYDRYAKNPMAGVIGFGGIFAICAAMWVWNKLQEKKFTLELKSLDILTQEESLESTESTNDSD